MDDLVIARSIHVLAVVIWIGGVSMVTTIVLRAAGRMTNGAQFAELVEHSFAWQARVVTLLVGGSGFYMVEQADLWDRFADAAYWWMHAMVGIWGIFTVILFIAEPLFLRRWFEARVASQPEATLALVQRAHWVLLTLSALTILGAVAGSHGWLWPAT
jgi:uncharacterized membrane protein